MAAGALHEQGRQRQIDQADDVYGAEGVKLVNDLHNFVAGINAYINLALTNPSLMPAEYQALGKVPQRWTPPT